MFFLDFSYLVGDGRDGILSNLEVIINLDILVLCLDSLGPKLVVQLVGSNRFFRIVFLFVHLRILNYKFNEFFLLQRQNS